jgi:hypothetical protein
MEAGQEMTFLANEKSGPSTEALLLSDLNRPVNGQIRFVATLGASIGDSLVRLVLCEPERESERASLAIRAFTGACGASVGSPVGIDLPAVGAPQQRFPALARTPKRESRNICYE